MNENLNKILVVIDGSYFLYFTCFAAVSEFQKKDPLEAQHWIKDAEDVDQNNLPNLISCESFKRILKRVTMRKCETLDYYLKGHFQDQIDNADSIDYVFAMDDFVKNNFRKALYPEYKAQRKLAKKSFDMFKIQQYILNVIFKELEVEEKYGYHFVRVDGAEGDDVIATIFKNIGKNYSLNVLFASDRDFVQLENVHQITLFGKEVKCTVADEDVTCSEYLLAKILLGDSADNISKVFNRVGPKKVLKLIRNKELLKEKLKEDQDAVKQFNLNKSLISFDEIPQDLTDKILETVNVKLYKNNILNQKVDFRDFMSL